MVFFELNEHHLVTLANAKVYTIYYEVKCRPLPPLYAPFGGYRALRVGIFECDLVTVLRSDFITDKSQSPGLGASPLGN